MSSENQFLGKVTNSKLVNLNVAYIELGLTDYPEIIKKPMDLKTCRVRLIFRLTPRLQNNLKKGKYKKYEEFFKDVLLIWDNCKTYNI